MAHYYFDLGQDHELLPDPEGVDLPDTAAVEKLALQTARAILAEEIRDGRVPLDMSLRVHDEDGLTVHRLPFASAITIVWPVDERDS